MSDTIHYSIIPIHDELLYEYIGPANVPVNYFQCNPTFKTATLFRPLSLKLPLPLSLTKNVKKSVILRRIFRGKILVEFILVTDVTYVKRALTRHPPELLNS